MNTTPTRTKDQLTTLIAYLGDEHGLTRQRARLMLVHLGEVSVPPLLEALRSDNVDVRFEAVKALGDLSDPRAAPALVDALFDQDTGVRWSAMEGLIKMGRLSLLPLLERFTKNFDSARLREGVRHILHVFKDRNLLTPEETTLFEKLEKQEIPGFEARWNTEAAWAAEKALEALDRQAKK